MDQNILPTLDMVVLQEKANQYAMQGALKSMEEYYTGWNSPFRKCFDEELKKTEIGSGMQLPDIIGLLNEKMSQEVDLIANTAISKTFAPLVKRFLTREDAEMNFSELLKKVIECSEEKEYENCELEILEEPKWGWLNIKMILGEKIYEITLHVNHETEKLPIKKYSLLSLPWKTPQKQNMMKISIDGTTLELPFTPDILKDSVVTFFARLVMAKTAITIDCDCFDEDMFPQDECHCD